MRNLFVKKIIKRCLALATVLTVSANSMLVYADKGDTGNGNSGGNGYLENQTEHTDEKFEDFKYAKVEMKDFDKLDKQLDKLIKDNADFSEIEAVLDEMELLYSRADANYCISNIYTTLDSDNEGYKKTYDKYHDFLVDLDDRLYISYNKIALSQYSSDFEKRIDDDQDWQYILKYKPMTDEQKELVDREDELSKEYDTIYNGEYTYEVNGIEYGFDELADAYDNGEVEYLDFANGLADIIMRKNQDLGELYIELIDIRTRIAKSYGYDNYVEYAYDVIYDREYRPSDLEAYYESVKTYYSPLLSEIQKFYQDNYSDVDVDEVELTEDEVYAMFTSKFDDISPDLYESYEYMRAHNLANMEILDKKAPTSYTTTISGDYNCPYLTVDANGSYSDLTTLIHEFGHYNQAYYQSPDDYLYGGTNLDLAEIHSQGMEIIYSRFADELYGEYGDAQICYNNLSYVYSVVEGCKENEFQVRVYENPEGWTVDKLNELYYEVSVEYGDADLFYNSYYLGMYNLGGLKPESIYEWVDIPHTFQSPLYYISYSVSMAAVEELREKILEDYQAGVDAYFALVEYGCTDSYYEGLEVAGLNNPIENPRFDVYANNIRKELGMKGASAGKDDDADDQGKDKDKKDKKDKSDKKDKKDKGDADKDSDAGESDDAKEGGFNLDRNTILYIAFFGSLSVFVILIIIIICIVVSNKKKKKASQEDMKDSKKDDNKVDDKNIEKAIDVPVSVIADKIEDIATNDEGKLVDTIADQTGKILDKIEDEKDKIVDESSSDKEDSEEDNKEDSKDDNKEDNKEDKVDTSDLDFLKADK